MIKKITIRDVASYDHEGVTFDNLAKVNIVYGGNGTGKTTLSRFLSISSKNQEIQHSNFKNCEIEWEGKPLEILVYNQDFKQRNLTEKMPGVFTIGENIKDIAPKHGTQVWKINKRLKELKKRGDDSEALAEAERLEKEKDAIFKDLISMQPSINTINRMLRLRYYGVQHSAVLERRVRLSNTTRGRLFGRRYAE